MRGICARQLFLVRRLADLNLCAQSRRIFDTRHGTEFCRLGSAPCGKFRNRKCRINFAAFKFRQVKFALRHRVAQKFADRAEKKASFFPQAISSIACESSTTARCCRSSKRRKNRSASEISTSCISWEIIWTIKNAIPRNLINLKATILPYRLRKSKRSPSRATITACCITTTW